MRDIFVLGLSDTNSDVMARLFEEDASNATNDFAKMLKIGLAKESSIKEKLADISPMVKYKQELPDDMHYQKQRRQASSSYHGNKQRYRGQAFSPQLFKETKKCGVCGRKNHESAKCKYRNYVCHKCGVKGHLAPVCKERRQHFLQDDDVADPSTSTQVIREDSIFCLTNIETDNKGNVKPIYVKLIVENIPMNFEIDSGFAHAAISEKMYLKYFKNKTLYDNDLSLKDYVGISFQPLGFLKLNIKFDNVNGELKIYVIRNGGVPLLGRNGLKMLKLGFSKLDYLSPNVNVAKCTEKLLNDYQDVFDNSLGTFNKFKISLKLKEGSIPRCFKPRAVPFALKPKIEAELDRLVSNKILIPNEYAEWGTPIVPVLKPDGSVRICGDFKVTINQYLVDMKHPLPRIYTTTRRSKVLKTGSFACVSASSFRQRFAKVGNDSHSQGVVFLHSFTFRYNKRSSHFPKYYGKDDYYTGSCMFSG